MENRLGRLLRQWRAERQLSISALAGRASVAMGTISGWERGTHEPRLPELESVLTALGASPQQRERALTLCHAPRFRRLQLAMLSGSMAGLDRTACPVAGHLLRAMRGRCGLSLEQVACRLAVRRSTVSRWESQASPPPDRLQRLFDLLGARPEERAALTDGRLLPAPSVAVPPASLDELTRELGELLLRARQGERALLDLAFLSWEARLWPLAVRCSAAQELLVIGWAYHARWLSSEDRKPEALIYARRALEWVQENPIPGRTLRSVLLQVLSTGRGSDRWPSRSAEPARLRHPMPHDAALE